MHGILYGGFNDEELFCYETGYSTIKDLEKAIKSKKYMIDDFADSFEEDDELINLDGEGRWKWLINYIEDSSVDGDSTDSLFLIDSNGYKILYCGSDSPSIEKVSTKKSKMILKTYQPNDDGPVIPYFKYGKYELNCSPSENNIEVSSSYFDKIFYDEFWDESYTLEEIEDKLNVDLLSLITDEQKIKFLELCKERKEYEEMEEKKLKKEKEKKLKTLQKKFSNLIGEEIKLDLVEKIYEYKYYLKNESFNNIQPELLHILNKCDIENSEDDGSFYMEDLLKYFTKGAKYYQEFMSNYNFINDITYPNKNLTLRKVYRIIESIIDGDSKEEVRLYASPNLNSYRMELIIEAVEYDEIPSNKLEKYVNANLDYTSLWGAILGLKNGLTDKQIKEVIKFITKHIESISDSSGYVSNHRSDYKDAIIPAIKKGYTADQLMDMLKKSGEFYKFIHKLYSKLEKD